MHEEQQTKNKMEQKMNRKQKRKKTKGTYLC